MKYIKHGCVILFTLFVTVVSAQTFGVKVGGGNGNLRIEYDKPEDIVKGENINGIEAGLFLQLDLNGLYVRPEALYLNRLGTVNHTDNSPISIHRIQFPVIVGLHLLGPLSIEGGPAYNHILEINHELGNDVRIRRDGLGYRIGPVLHFNRVMLYANYEGQVISLGTGSRLSEPSRLNFGVGLALGKKHF
ncbi:MAG: hypothetical protein KDD36_06520 [Flavobacteriales bacterium]|nr:hypothetical protein [Flavobacteriales bacterium]